MTQLELETERSSRRCGEIVFGTILAAGLTIALVIIVGLVGTELFHAAILDRLGGLVKRTFQFIHGSLSEELVEGFLCVGFEIYGCIEREALAAVYCRHVLVTRGHLLLCRLHLCHIIDIVDFHKGMEQTLLGFRTLQGIHVAKQGEARKGIVFEVVGHEAVEIAATKCLVGERQSHSERESESFVPGYSAAGHGFAEFLFVVQLGIGRHGTVPEEATGQTGDDDTRGSTRNIHVTHIGVEVTVLVVFLLHLPDTTGYGDIEEFLDTQGKITLETFLLISICPTESALDCAEATTEGTVEVKTVELKRIVSQFCAGQIFETIEFIVGPYLHAGAGSEGPAVVLAIAVGILTITHESQLAYELQCDTFIICVGFNTDVFHTQREAPHRLLC